MIKRELYLNKIRPFIDSDLIKVIIGIRRCGKSVLMKQIISEIKEKHVDDAHIIYLNFEDLQFSFIENEMDLYRYIKDKIQDEGKYYLLFDEIQNVNNFEKAINSFRATLNCSVFLTGSNGKLLSGELATHLSGRYVSFKIMPFSFKEMCKVKDISKDRVSEKDFMEYLNFGGMPQRFLMETESQVKIYLRDLYDSIVLRDIVLRSKVSDVDVLNRIVEYMVMNTSQTFSAKSISAYFESISRKVSMDTIYQYLEHITNSLIFNKVMRYDIRGKKILTRSDKFYLSDLGFAKINNTEFKTEIGALIENIVYNELINRGYEVYVGKTVKGEIDFIVMNDGEKSYYQALYLLADEKIIDREFGAYESVRDNFPKYVLSMDKLDFSRDGIVHKNILDFLLED